MRDGLVCAATSRVDRTGRAFIGIGLASYATGTLVYISFIQHLDGIPYPSISDGLWMLLSLAILGIGLMARIAGSVASMWQDGVVPGLSGYRPMGVTSCRVNISAGR